MPEATPANPGSLVDYAEARGEDPQDSLVARKYFTELGEYRKSLAEHLGVSLEDLHFGMPRNLGGLALSKIESK